MGFRNEPIRIQRRDGSPQDPYLDLTESRKVIDGWVFLKEIPSKFDRVVVKDSSDTLYSEVSKRDKISNNKNFFVDYEEGIVYFHNSANGLQLSFTYKGTGVILYPASRIYLSNGSNDIEKSVQDILDNYELGGGAVQSVNGKIGNVVLTASDLNAYTKTEISTLLENKVDKVSGKQLSTENFTTAEKTKLSNIASGANNYTHPTTHPASIIEQNSNNRFVTDAEKATWDSKASTSTATTSANGLMSSTDKTKLDGIATGANNYVHPTTHNPNIIVQDSNNRFVTDAQISTWNGKANLASPTFTGTPTAPTATVGTNTTQLATTAFVKQEINSVIITTGLATTSTNGLMSSIDKTKLDGIASNANNYVHPTTHPASMIEQSSSYRFVTDAQISAWNASTGGVTALVTTTTNGLMSSTDKVKLDGIATGANNYIHPSTHPATIIEQTSSYRFVTDAEKSTWNAKASTTVATTSANGLMSSTDKSKLDGIASGANNYTHPTSHSPSIISQDSNNRFVTDTQISTWNGKYAKPTSGIPKTDLDSTVQASLAKADTAFQSSKITISSSAPTGGANGDIWLQY